MKQRELVESVCILLLRNGYVVKALARSCFDIVARSGERVVLVKAVEDANTLSPDTIGEMVRVSEYLAGVPVIVADKAGFELEKNVVYMRQGVYALSLSTFENAVMNRLPFIKSSKAGVTVQVDGDALRKKREEEGLSLNELAAKVGVSRNMIQKYEHGAEITVQKAVKMYDRFGGEVFKRIDVFSARALGTHPELKKGDIASKYSELGFKADEMQRSPFDVIARKKEELILTSVGDRFNPHVSEVSKLLDSDKLMIYKRKKPKDIPAMKKKEFMELEKAKELIKILKEF
ncbi:helix-turn-helix domain-containing protein [Candidatus Woesearchaeota archaeon]|nr:helix-turn-helix domain-containing protein [Candidatus Woesearchaeota archaeon]